MESKMRDALHGKAIAFCELYMCSLEFERRHKAYASYNTDKRVQ